MKPLVTIVMPVYNVAQYVERALLSAIRQTYSNLEILVVDDCGPDNSMDIVAETIAKYDTRHCVRILHHEHNRGLSAARNTGLDNMSGDYVYFMDSDDEITADCIEHLYSLVEKHPNVEMVIGNMSVPLRPGCSKEDYGRGRDFTHFPEYSEDRDWIVRNIFDASNGYFIPSTSVNKLQRKDFFVKNHLRFMEGIIHEDEKMVFDYAECIQSIAFYPSVTYLRYWNEGSIMSSLTSTRSIRAWNTIIMTSLPAMGQPYLGLKLANALCELVHKFVELPKNVSFQDILNTKRTFCAIACKARKVGYPELARECRTIIFTPLRVARLTKNKRILNEKYTVGNLLKICNMLNMSKLSPPPSSVCVNG